MKFKNLMVVSVLSLVIVELKAVSQLPVVTHVDVKMCPTPRHAAFGPALNEAANYLKKQRYVSGSTFNSVLASIGIDQSKTAQENWKQLEKFSTTGKYSSTNFIVTTYVNNLNAANFSSHRLKPCITYRSSTGVIITSASPTDFLEAVINAVK